MNSYDEKAIFKCITPHPFRRRFDAKACLGVPTENLADEGLCNGAMLPDPAAVCIKYLVNFLDSSSVGNDKLHALL
jgi:hypothetical protein